MCLAVIHFLIGYPLGSFICYYPVEKNILGDLFQSPSFASLVLSNQRFFDIPWFIYVINSELKTVIKQANGYELAYKIVASKSNSFEQHFGTYLLNTIEMDLQKIKSANWESDKVWILKILEEYCLGRNYTERAEKLKKMVEARK